ncbi:MAG: hypothetical protein ACOVOJ_02285, partial [Pirellula sp.]
EQRASAAGWVARAAASVEWGVWEACFSGQAPKRQARNFRTQACASQESTKQPYTMDAAISAFIRVYQRSKRSVIGHKRFKPESLLL